MSRGGNSKEYKRLIKRIERLEADVELLEGKNFIQDCFIGGTIGVLAALITFVS